MSRVLGLYGDAHNRRRLHVHAREAWTEQGGGECGRSLDKAFEASDGANVTAWDLVDEFKVAAHHQIDFVECEFGAMLGDCLEILDSCRVDVEGLFSLNDMKLLKGRLDGDKCVMYR